MVTGVEILVCGADFFFLFFLFFLSISFYQFFPFFILMYGVKSIKDLHISFEF